MNLRFFSSVSPNLIFRCRLCESLMNLKKLMKRCCLFIYFADAPLCRAGQHRVYGVARHEEARIICELDANPLTSMHFRWLFNSSAGVIELPPSTWTTDGAGRSVARYLPQSDLDFGTLLCSASNVIGNQAVPCLYHVIPAGQFKL